MSETRTLLLELHCEEIPARFLKPLTADFEKACSAFLDQNQLRSAPSAAKTAFSPRKLSWAVSGILAAQSDQSETQVGPPQRMCLDEQGQPTQTGLKFAEKWGVDFGAIRFEQPAGKKEPCAVVTLTKRGRPTMDLLAEALPRLISELHVPKAMRWGHSEFEFVRPIRNILCLFGQEVVPFEVDGVKTSRTTWGHRLFHMKHAEPVAISSIETYEQELEKAGIVVSFDQRRQRIETDMEALAAEVGGRVVEDGELLNTLAEIVEYPRVVRGQFPQAFMALPKEVLVTSLKEHQKSFCIENATGELLPYFLAAANRPDDPAGFIKSGNEWVLKARLYDARFFFEEDRRTPLLDRLDSLQHLTFHRELGSYFEKTERIAAIAGELAKRLDLDAQQAGTAARNCKCDLRTLMVGEFPELQGVMGGEYLRHEQAPEGVWKAVKEHYQPVAAETPIPATELGCVLAVADKLDTLVGCFAIGQIPSGSKDPLALRRAGAGAELGPEPSGTLPHSAASPRHQGHQARVRHARGPGVLLPGPRVLPAGGGRVHRCGAPLRPARGLDQPGGPQGALRRAVHLCGGRPLRQPGPERQAHRQHPEGRGALGNAGCREAPGERGEAPGPAPGPPGGGHGPCRPAGGPGGTGRPSGSLLHRRHGEVRGACAPRRSPLSAAPPAEDLPAGGRLQPLAVRLKPRLHGCGAMEARDQAPLGPDPSRTSTPCSVLRRSSTRYGLGTTPTNP